MLRKLSTWIVVSMIARKDIILNFLIILSRKMEGHETKVYDPVIRQHKNKPLKEVLKEKHEPLHVFLRPRSVTITAEELLSRRRPFSYFQ